MAPLPAGASRRPSSAATTSPRSAATASASCRRLRNSAACEYTQAHQRVRAGGWHRAAHSEQKLIPRGHEYHELRYTRRSTAEDTRPLECPPGDAGLYLASTRATSSRSTADSSPSA